MSTLHQKAWHQLQAEEVIQLLGVDLQSGLPPAEVKRRQAEFGPNQLTVRRGASVLKQFLLQFSEPLMYVLVIAGTVTVFLGEVVDASVIFGVVLVNAMVGCLQEAKAEKAIEALSRLVVTEASVRRDGRRRRIDSTELVPGDVVLLQSGDKVPADLRLFSTRGLQVDESALTGESVPVEKHSNPLALDTILAERKNLAYAGTLVTHGQAEGVVWATGDRTETGRIARLLHEAVDLSTPLTRKITQFSKLLLWVVLALAVVMFVAGVWRGQPPFEMFMAAVALAVGAIPEGLPAAVTITLAIGVARMARRGAIIRKLPAVETLGSTTVICSDKTGTLTENQMTVQEIYAGGKLYEVTGTGYEAGGEIRWRQHPVSLPRHPALEECLKAGLLNNDAQLVRADGRLKVEGDPTEAALIVAAQKAGLIQTAVHAAHPRLDVIPFESEHQFMATLHGRGEGKPRVIYKKGSMERLIERCSHALADDGQLAPLDPEAIRLAADTMAARGLRVLAFVRRDVAQDHARLHHEHVKSGLTFLGLQGMIDPPRAEAVQSIRTCHGAGIRVKMITGDHLLTAQAVAERLGLLKPGGPRMASLVASGRELDRISNEALPEFVEHAIVFARVAPEQKLRLVTALQARGHIVAMTGDGVNDAPALKQADIGVAMGINGTEVAKGAADMLLTDDNFASIEAAVEEGRGVFDNLTKFLLCELPTNVAESLILLVAIFTGSVLPALPVQFLWVNMTTSVLLGLALVFEPKERGLMRRPPRDPRAPILTFQLLMRTGLVSLLALGGAYGLFLWEQRAGGANLAQARTVVINVIVVVEAFYLLNCRSLLHAPWSIGFFSNRWVFAGLGGMFAVQVAFTHLPLMHRLFHSASISLEQWLRVLAVGLVTFLVVEFEKWIRLKLGASEGTGVRRQAGPAVPGP